MKAAILLAGVLASASFASASTGSVVCKHMSGQKKPAIFASTNPPIKVAAAAPSGPHRGNREVRKH